MTSKYAPLALFLAANRADTCTLSFQQVEQVLGHDLPASARDHRAWWSNDLEGGSHVQAVRGWNAAGWIVEQVDLPAQTVSFRRSGQTGASRSLL